MKLAAADGGEVDDRGVVVLLRCSSITFPKMSATSVTTTLKLTEALKARIGRVAAEAGKSSHAFMLEAIERHTALAERRRDLGRVVASCLQQSAVDAAATVPLISSALQIPKQHPMIGRPVEAGLRVLRISRGHRGYVALYRHDTASDTVMVLALRYQRERH